jgi:uncharacterized protein YkwD
MLRVRFGLLLGLALCACTSLVDHPVDEGEGGDGSSSNNTGGSTGGKPATPGSGAPGADAQSYVDAHNAVRAAVEEPAGYAGTWRPLAPVTWSESAAAGAQEWANHLASELDCGLEHAGAKGYGENLAAGTNLSAKGAVELWASEKKNYVYAKSYEFSTNTGHYTQIVWRDSTQIGCASAKCSRSTVVVCRYQPQGNFLGAAIY